MGNTSVRSHRADGVLVLSFLFDGKPEPSRDKIIQEGDIMKNDDITLGKFISLILRHKPETIGITLDREGWADTRQLIEGINAAGHTIDMETLERIVRENDKKRYSFNGDKTRIRANQGHSIPVDTGMRQAVPPEKLYHGTADRFLDSIRSGGIKKMSRQYVHLSADTETAVGVGKRHGRPVVLVIDTKAMTADGFIFRISENGVWQSEDIPWKYVAEVISAEQVAAGAYKKL